MISPRPWVWLLAVLAAAVSHPAPAEAPPPPRPPAFAPPAPPAPPVAAPAAAPVAAPAPRRLAAAPATASAALSPGAISRSMSREAHALLYRLDLRLQQFSRDYNRPVAARPSATQLDGQLDEIETLLGQLRQHPLPSERQSTLFKTEMNLRRLRETTIPDR